MDSSTISSHLERVGGSWWKGNVNWRSKRISGNLKQKGFITVVTPKEYANAYYGYETELQSDDMLKVAAENQVTKVEIDEEEKIWKNQSQ